MHVAVHCHRIASCIIIHQAITQEYNFSTHAIDRSLAPAQFITNGVIQTRTD